MPALTAKTWPLVERKRFYRSLRRAVRDGLNDQIKDFVNESDFFPFFLLEKGYGSDKTPEMIYQEVEKNVEALAYFISVDEIFDMLVLASEYGGDSYLEKVGINATFRLTNLELVERIRSRQDLLIGKINPVTNRVMGRGLLDQTTIEYISGVITRGVLEGSSNIEISDQLLKNSKIISENRADMIAHAEISNAINTMELEAAIRNGSEEKRWDDSGDSRVTDECLENAAQRWIGIREQFHSGHQKPPRFPRCRCVIEYTDPPRTEEFWFGD